PRPSTVPRRRLLRHHRPFPRPRRRTPPSPFSHRSAPGHHTTQYSPATPPLGQPAAVLLLHFQAVICGKVGQVPVQKILSNGHTVTVFTLGTAGMFDQRIVGDNLPMPAQWHRIAVHNEELGAYAVQKLVKNSAVYVEGDIETRVYNDRVHGQVKNIPEICVRRDGKVRLLQSGESDVSKSLDELREGLF
ncbi:unnamed protein product, partial [Urochloa humidicola]